MITDVDRLIKLVSRVAAGMAIEGQIGGPEATQGSEDLEQELLAYAFDAEAQSKRGIKIVDSDSDQELKANLRRVGNEWLREVWRSDTASTRCLATENSHEHLGIEAEEVIAKKVREVEEEGCWSEEKIGNRIVDLEAELAQIKSKLKGPVRQPSEGQRFLAKVLSSEPGERRGQRRLLARALWKMARSGRGPDVLLLFRRHRYGETLGSTDRKRLSRASDYAINEVNRILSSDNPRAGYGGPGARRAISNAKALALSEHYDTGDWA